MNLKPLQFYASDGTYAKGVEEAEFILNTLVSEANGVPGESGDFVSVTKNYFADDMAKVWRYLVDKTATIAVPRNAFFDDTDRVQTKVGTQNCAVIFSENDNTITLQTNRV